MPGYLYALVTCYGCKRPFSCNPHLVPSVLIQGVREPICPQCVEKANPARIDRGLSPIVVLPGAYAPDEV